MKQIILLFALLVGMMTFVYWSSKGGNLEKIFGGVIPTTPQTTKTVIKILTPDGEKIVAHEIKVEIVDTVEEREIGLSKYTSLEPDKGMLFLFDKTDVKPEFWMKNMVFPIDIIWINDSKIAEISSNVLPPINPGPDEKLIRYIPKSGVDQVLEIKAGEAERRGFRVGNDVTLPTL